MKYKKESIEYFCSKFKFEDPKKKKVKSCRIKVNGQFIVMPNGKTVWRRIGHAKSALVNALGSKFTFVDSITGIEGFKLNYREADKYYQNFIDFLQKEGILEFVEIDF